MVPSHRNRLKRLPYLLAKTRANPHRTAPHMHKLPLRYHPLHSHLATRHRMSLHFHPTSCNSNSANSTFQVPPFPVRFHSKCFQCLLMYSPCRGLFHRQLFCRVLRIQANSFLNLCCSLRVVLMVTPRQVAQNDKACSLPSNLPAIKDSSRNTTLTPSSAILCLHCHSHNNNNNNNNLIFLMVRYHLQLLS